MNAPIHKVTCLITHPGQNGIELLLFNHPSVGVRIPAGTANPGEELETAARREATEETGLTDLVLERSLGQADDPPPDGYLLVAQSTPVYSRPDTSSYDWAHFLIGLPVKVLRHVSGFTQVCFEETDRYIDPQYATYTITVITHRLRNNICRCAGEGFEMWHLGFLPCASTSFTQ